MSGQIAGWPCYVKALGGQHAPVPNPEKPVVLFQTPWMRPDDGWSIAGRRYARAMREGGLDVRLVAYGREQTHELTPEVVAEVDGMIQLDRILEWDQRIFSLPLMSAKNTLPKLFEPGARHFVFETCDVDPKISNYLNTKVEAVWAQCSANWNALVTAGVQNVTLIGMPWFDDDPLLGLPISKRSDRFLFIGRPEQRKAPDRLVAAFLRAFTPGQATLTIKLSAWKNPRPYPSPEDSIADELLTEPVTKRGWNTTNVNEAIHVMRGTLSRGEMKSLYAQHDVYASASRGEGWDLPAFEAKLAGRRVVTTDSGGPRDFLSDGDILVAANGTVPAPVGEAGNSYIDYPLDALVEALRMARRCPGPGSRVPERLHSSRIGEQFRTWIGFLCGK